MKGAEGISVSHALQLLRRDLVPTESAGPPPKLSTVPKFPPLFSQTNDDKRLLEIVVSYYHESLKQSPEAQQFLIKRGILVDFQGTAIASALGRHNIEVVESRYGSGRSGKE